MFGATVDQVFLFSKGVSDLEAGIDYYELPGRSLKKSCFPKIE